MRVGRKLSKIPLKGVEQKGGEGTQRFKKKGGGGKLGQGVGALKREGAGTPLQTMYINLEGTTFPFNALLLAQATFAVYANTFVIV